MDSETSTGGDAALAMVRADFANSGGGRGWLAGFSDSRISLAPVDAKAGTARNGAMAVRLRAGVVAPRNAYSPHSGWLPADASAATPLLRASHGCRRNHRSQLDSLASDSLVPAAHAQAGSGAWARRHRLSHAPGRAHRKGAGLRDGSVLHFRNTGLQHEHRAGWT